MAELHFPSVAQTVGFSRRAFVTTNEADILKKWQLLSPYLNRRQQICWAAAETFVIGAGGCRLLAAVTGIAASTISNQRCKMRLTRSAPAGSRFVRRRTANVGRKLTEVNDPEIESALQLMLSEEIAGDPMNLQRWVRSSTRNLSRRLTEHGHQVGYRTVARLLRKMGYSLQAAKRRKAGAEHPDRDKQFQHISALKAQFLGQGLPVISIDTKKKELIGNYRPEGKTWRKEPIEVEDSFFASYAKCIAVPFGIYDVAKNVGYVTVGISGNTAELSVNCLVTWWKQHGRPAYKSADRLLILADGGGSNGYNLRTWKMDLQEKLCDDFGLRATLCHYPLACSKWNPIEYRLFSQISLNWAGQPLSDLDVMLGFIRGTTTTAGLKVEAYLDKKIYRNGRRVTEEQLRELALSEDDICPRWNYTLAPRPKS
jgi:Rhodopirellula transposase DDE domain